MASWVKFEIDGCTLTFEQRLFMGSKSNIIENVNLKKTEFRVGDFLAIKFLKVENNVCITWKTVGQISRNCFILQPDKVYALKSKPIEF